MINWKVEKRKVKLTKVHPFAQKVKCSVCKRMVGAMNDIAIASPNKLICYKCKDKKI